MDQFVVRQTQVHGGLSQYRQDQHQVGEEITLHGTTDTQNVKTCKVLLNFAIYMYNTQIYGNLPPYGVDHATIDA